MDNAWKERGVGEMKVLIQFENPPAGLVLGSRSVIPDDYKLENVSKSRLLMRRDQVLKLCVNQSISPDHPNFKAMGLGNSVCWVAEDYSEGSASLDSLAVRFKVRAFVQMIIILN